MPADRDVQTVLYLIRHGATEDNLARPARLQGRRNRPLAQHGVRQAEATRDFLASCRLERCYSSPLHRALHTAAIVAEPHGLSPEPIDELTECDVGRWEGLDWDTIRKTDLEAYRRFHEHPAAFGYPDGESFAAVHERVAPVLDSLLHKHRGQTLLVVSHHVVNRTYLAGLLGLSPDEARRVALDNCGISVVVREGECTFVSTLNATFHLQNLAA